MDACTSALLTDFYQLTMLRAYQVHGMQDTAVFELFVRRMPQQRNFLVAAGLEQSLQFLENLCGSPRKAIRPRASRCSRSLAPADPPYPVHVSPRLRKLANEVDAMNPS